MAPRIKKQRPNYSEEQLIEVLAKIKSRKMSMRQASRDYGVPCTTLNVKINFRKPMDWNTKRMVNISK